MAICDDCAHRRDCTFPRTTTTRECDEYDASQLPEETHEWDLSEMMTNWGYTAPGKA